MCQFMAGAEMVVSAGLAICEIPRCMFNRPSIERGLNGTHDSFDFALNQAG
jgi:hypothetical protein